MSTTESSAIRRFSIRRLLASLDILVALLVVVAIAGAFGWRWIAYGQYIESTDNAYIQGEITPINPKVSGYIAELLVTDNQHVREGEILLRIEDREYQQQLAGVEAEGERIVAEIEGLAQKKVLQGHMVDQAAADIAIAEAEFARATSELERSAKLIKSGNTSNKANELIIAAHSRAKGALSRATAMHLAAQAQIAILEADARKLDAVAKKTRAELALLQMRLEDTVIRSPVDGVVGNRSVRLGQLVEPGRFLMAVVPLNDVWVEANFKETQLTRVQVGQEVDIHVDTFPDYQFKGRVAGMSPASGAEFSILPPQNASGNFTKIVQRIPVKIEIIRDSEMAGKLRPGMSSTVSINTKSTFSTSARLAVD
jgi:membrane fusion protein (multidrug efflux system)